MSKPKKQRNVQHPPLAVYFKPQGIPLFQLEQIVLNVDEYEALRLVDYEGLNQLDAATQLGISRPTCARIVEQAHKKVAEAITLGKAIRIEGGAFALLKNLMRCRDCGKIWEATADDTPDGSSTKADEIVCPHCHSAKATDLGNAVGGFRHRRGMGSKIKP